MELILIFSLFVDGTLVNKEDLHYVEDSATIFYWYSPLLVHGHSMSLKLTSTQNQHILTRNYYDRDWVSIVISDGVFMINGYPTEVLAKTDEWYYIFATNEKVTINDEEFSVHYIPEPAPELENPPTYIRNVRVFTKRAPDRPSLQ